jgi:hypothetical protein
MATHCLQHLAEGRLSSPVCSLRQAALTKWVEGCRLFNEEDNKNKIEGKEDKKKKRAKRRAEKRRLRKKTRQRKSSRCKRRRRRDKEEGEGRKIGEGLHQKEEKRT